MDRVARVGVFVGVVLLGAMAGPSRAQEHGAPIGQLNISSRRAIGAMTSNHRLVRRVARTRYPTRRAQPRTSILRGAFAMRAGIRQPLGRNLQAGHSTGGPLLRTIHIYGAVVAADDSTNRTFVLDTIPGTVSLLDARSGNLLGTTRIGPSPQYVTVDAPLGRVFVSSDQGITILNARSGNVLHKISESGLVAVAKQASHIFVCSYRGRDKPSLVRMFDVRNNTVLQSVHVGTGACNMTVAEHAERVFVSNSTADSVSVLDARRGTILRTVHVSGEPSASAVDERTGRIFILTGGSVSMFDAHSGTLLHTTPVNSGPSSIAVNQGTGRIFVTTQNTVDVLDARSAALIHSTNVDTFPASTPIVNAATGHVLVLLTSPKGSESGQADGPGMLLALDGNTGTVRRRVETAQVLSFGLTDVVAADARTKRVFVLDGNGVEMYDATKL